MNKLNNNYYTDNEEPRGYIQPQILKDLWFHTGTICNLNCSFCFEDSSPTSNRIEKLTFEDAKPLIDEAVEMGVEKFSFTGGEPFVNREFCKILDYALDFKPCLILTNGTDPLLNKITKLATFKKKTFDLSFRISLDSPIENEHDKYRGQGNFQKALQSLNQLSDLGFEISIAARNEDDIYEFRKLFAKYAISEHTPIIIFPELKDIENTPEISENCMTTYKTEKDRSLFMCNYTKMIVKKESMVRVYACTLVDDDEFYDLGLNLKESLNKKIILKNSRCFSCFSSGVSCGG